MKKEEIEEKRKKEMIRQLRKGPDLEEFLEGRKRKFITYAQGASLYSMNYYSFIALVKVAHIRKKGYGKDVDGRSTVGIFFVFRERLIPWKGRKS